MREWQESSEKLAEETRKAKEEWEKMEEEKKRKAEERKKTEELRRKQEARKRACRCKPMPSLRPSWCGKKCRPALFLSLMGGAKHVTSLPWEARKRSY
ncbi:hypothetical protein G6O67_006234 [Ophiocordyceps sinensis]|uniref:Uncharacterized protein n=1 Tax=Ophiocordyceps sinensis TaxID=72228 RepID=A0A8H4LWG2_9HYPO|nr:hypothetical protein G6O67_006234 [Ophiocordyceps sinensis]